MESKQCLPTLIDDFKNLLYVRINRLNVPATSTYLIKVELVDLEQPDAGRFRVTRRYQSFYNKYINLSRGHRSDNTKCYSQLTSVQYL